MPIIKTETDEERIDRIFSEADEFYDPTEDEIPGYEKFCAALADEPDEPTFFDIMKG